MNNRSINAQDLQDIREYIITHVEDYMADYVRFGSYLPFPDYTQTRITVQLAHRFDRYQIQEAFDSDKIQALLAFYMPEEDEEAKITQH